MADRGARQPKRTGVLTIAGGIILAFLILAVFGVACTLVLAGGAGV